MDQLPIPSATLTDPDAFEILRVWAANEEQHVSIHSGLNGDAYDFGYLIAQLAFHGSKLYAQRMNQSEESMLRKILEGFNTEIKDQSGNTKGSITK